MPRQKTGACLAHGEAMLHWQFLGTPGAHTACLWSRVGTHARQATRYRTRAFGSRISLTTQSPHTHQWGGNSFFSTGWNPRHIEGIEHFFFYNLELVSKQKFIHGQPVCLGFILGCLMHDKYGEKFQNFFKNIEFDIRPEAMNISWEIVRQTLSSLNAFILSNNLWYGIGSEQFNVDEIFNNLKEKVIQIY